MARLIHSTSELCSQLDTKIAALEAARNTVIEKLKAEIGVPINTEALHQITKSLAHARDARYSAEESCCGYTCTIDYQE